LSGRGPGERTGDVLVNGRSVVSRKKLRSLISYVPREEDLPYERLTVRQVLTSSALLRCPGTQDQKLAHVEATLEELELKELADRVVGDLDVEHRKAAAVAIELLTPRPLLFVDDAPLATLRRAAQRESRTVLVTALGPSEHHDRLLLLSGGTVTFDGPPSALLTHFDAAGGATPPEPHDAATHVVELLTGHKQNWAEVWAESEARKKLLADADDNVRDLAAKPSPLVDDVDGCTDEEDDLEEQDATHDVNPREKRRRARSASQVLADLQNLHT